MWREYTTVTRLKHSKVKMLRLALIAHPSHQSFGVFNMKKSLVALATMSVVASAFADVDVSGGVKMYGVLDQGLTSQNVTYNGTSVTYPTISWLTKFPSLMNAPAMATGAAMRSSIHRYGL